MRNGALTIGVTLALLLCMVVTAMAQDAQEWFDRALTRVIMSELSSITTGPLN